MRFSRNWIAAYVDLPQDGELSEVLSMLGLVVDDLRPRGDDAILDLDVASNRPDLMNHLAVAREVGLATARAVVPPSREIVADGPATASISTVRIEDPVGCPRFVARAIVEVDIGPSPRWLCDRLESIGLRPINSVVDVTNFVMWELGRPMHAYDLDRLAGETLVARRARAGEKLVTLDDVERELHVEDLVIADEERPVGLAGVMGGAATGVTESTTHVLLECAAFDPSVVRATARRHGLHTDASHRFERGLSTSGIMAATDRAAHLIREIAGGRVAGSAIDERGREIDRRPIRLPLARVSGVLGIRVDPEDLRSLLMALDFGIEETEGGFDLTAPAARLDISLPEDVIEEIARFHGYDRLPSTLPLLRRADSRGLEPDLAAERHVKRLSAALGLWEAMTFTFTGEAEQRAFLEPGVELVRLTNPLSEGLAFMRAHLMPGLLGSVARNLNQGLDRVRLFELGRVFRAGTSAPVERRHLGIAITGDAVAAHHGESPRPIGFVDLRGILDTIAARMQWPQPRWSAAAVPGLQEGVSARIRIGDASGFAGRVDESVTGIVGAEAPVWILEIDVHDLLGLEAPPVSARPLPRFPSSSRDSSLIVPRGVAYEELEESLSSLDGIPLESIALVDLYRGDDLPEGTVGMTIRLTYRAADRTLTADEVESAHGRALGHLEESRGVRRR